METAGDHRHGVGGAVCGFPVEPGGDVATGWVEERDLVVAGGHSLHGVASVGTRAGPRSRISAVEAEKVGAHSVEREAGRAPDGPGQDRESWHGAVDAVGRGSVDDRDRVGRRMGRLRVVPRRRMERGGVVEADFVLAGRHPAHLVATVGSGAGAESGVGAVESVEVRAHSCKGRRRVVADGSRHGRHDGAQRRVDAGGVAADGDGDGCRCSARRLVVPPFGHMAGRWVIEQHLVLTGRQAARAVAAVGRGARQARVFAIAGADDGHAHAAEW